MELQIKRPCFLGLINPYTVMVKNNILYKTDRPFFAYIAYPLETPIILFMGTKPHGLGKKKRSPKVTVGVAYFWTNSLIFKTFELLIPGKVSLLLYSLPIMSWDWSAYLSPYSKREQNSYYSFFSVCGHLISPVAGCFVLGIFFFCCCCFFLDFLEDFFGVCFCLFLVWFF